MELEEKSLRYKMYQKIFDIDNGLYIKFDGNRSKAADECAKIAEGFAVGFAEWVSKSVINGQYYSHSRDNIWHGQYNPDERHYNPLTTQELLELYKQHLIQKQNG